MPFDFSKLKIDANKNDELIIGGEIKLNENEKNNLEITKFLIKAYAIRKAIIYKKLNWPDELINLYITYYRDFFEEKTEKWTKTEENFFMNIVYITIPDSNVKIRFV